MAPDAKAKLLPDVSINTLTTDFRADVIAAELIENGVPADTVIMVPVGGFQRSYRKDVETVSEDYSDNDKKKYYHVKTHREGIYDMLPEGLFHKPISVKNTTSESEIAEAIERHKTEEADARRFFLPFEAAIYRLRIEMTLYENRLDKKAHHNDLLNIFANHWEVFRYLDVQQSNIFLQVLPLIHELRDQHELIERLLEMIFDISFSISIQLRSPDRPHVAIVSVMGQDRLGVDLTTGNKKYRDGEDEILVRVGPLEDHQMNDFLPGCKSDRILQYLFDYLLPAHMEVVVELVQNPSQRGARLRDKEKVTKSVLGFSTYL
jgi:type VI secretion system protein ImpH